MRVERYSGRYFLDVLHLVENFHNEAVGEFDHLIDVNAVVQTIESADKKNAFLLIVDDACQGILYGTRIRSHMNGGEIFQEVMWYVNPSFRGLGVKMFSEVCQLLKSEGVNSIIMVVLENSKKEKLKKLYEDVLHLKPMETHYWGTI